MAADVALWGRMNSYLLQRKLDPFPLALESLLLIIVEVVSLILSKSELKQALSWMLLLLTIAAFLFLFYEKLDTIKIYGIHPALRC